MLEIQAFLRSYALFLVAMALLACVEALLPLTRERTWRRRHLLPNLALAALTLGSNLVLFAGALLITGWLASRGFGVLAGAALPPLALTAIGIVALDAAT